MGFVVVSLTMGNLPLPFGDGLGGDAEVFAEYSLTHVLLSAESADGSGNAESVHDGSFLMKNIEIISVGIRRTAP